jgi:hypothetical protein
MHAGHGPNIGHGYVKYIVIDGKGHELAPIVFPAMTAPAGRSVDGALAQAAAIELGGRYWWVGDDAQLAESPLTFLAQDRLTDELFIPTLLRGALARMGSLNGASVGTCVTGLPATWASDQAKAKALGARLRAATTAYTSIRVIPEPLGLIYSQLLNTHGAIVGDPALQTGRVAVVDLGHLTVDIAEIQRMVPIADKLDTYSLGTAQPLKQIRARLSAHFERELTLHETDMAVRAGALRVAGHTEPLPVGWDRPLIENGESVASRLRDTWGRGKQFDTILIGGGGAEIAPLAEAICHTFGHAVRVDEPQLAIARGYARLARRLGQEAK